MAYTAVMNACPRQKTRKPSQHLPIILLTTVGFLAGCSALRPLSRVFQGDETKPAASTSEATYYTSEVGVKLYSEPRFSSSSVATLPLHQKVYRSKLEKGFAYVSVEGTGQTGWVDNGKLIWRLPAHPAATVKPGDSETTLAPTAGPEPEPAGSVAREIPAVPGETTAVEKPVAAEDAPADAAQPEETEDADPSAFSPF